MSILSRYILRELLLSSLLFFTVFSTLLTLLFGTITIKDFIGLDPSFKILLRIYALTFFHLLSLLIPLSSFFGTLMTFYRLREDKELLALLSLGFNIKNLLLPTVLFMLFVFLLTHFSHFYLLPYSKREKRLIHHELSKNVTQKHFPIKKPVNITENLYIYVRSVRPDENIQKIKGLLLLERGSSGKKTLYKAESAEVYLKEGIIWLDNGLILSSSPKGEMEILSFGRYQIYLHEGALRADKIQFKRGEMTIKELRSAIAENKGKDLRRYFLLISEYYHRYIYALSIAPLIIHAFFFSLFLHIHHRVYFFLIGIIFYTLFYYGYNFFLSLGEKGNLSPLLALIIFNSLSFIIILFEFYLLIKKGITSVLK